MELPVIGLRLPGALGIVAWEVAPTSFRFWLPLSPVWDAQEVRAQTSVPAGVWPSRVPHILALGGRPAPCSLGHATDERDVSLSTQRASGGITPDASTDC